MDTILIEEPISKITITPVKTIDTFDVFEVQPAFARFESRPALAGCKSLIPGDCDVICCVVYDAIKKEIPVKKIVATPTYSKEKQKGRFKTIKKRVILTPATVREIEIPAEYVTIQKRVLEKDETVDTLEVGAVVREEVLFIRDKRNSGAGDGFEWRKIECELLDYNVLPIYYGFNSDVLDAKARDVVEDKLYNLMKQRPEIRVEINSFTDSRIGSF
ncbi:MAG: hypothetical protein IPH31_14405 [Lewinellaceae bacterium]|nr:hypothetical protein [Lewinellaceae bacterium]